MNVTPAEMCPTTELKQTIDFHCYAIPIRPLAVLDWKNHFHVSSKDPHERMLTTFHGHNPSSCLRLFSGFALLYVPGPMAAILTAPI